MRGFAAPKGEDGNISALEPIEVSMSNLTFQESSPTQGPCIVIPTCHPSVDKGAVPSSIPSAGSTASTTRINSFSGENFSVVAIDPAEAMSRFAIIFVGSIAIAINGSLSHFKPGQSTHAQRVWTMTWLAFGIAFGPWTLMVDGEDLGLLGKLGAVVYFAPSVGGFVVVAKMLIEYGHCIQTGGWSL